MCNSVLEINYNMLESKGKLILVNNYNDLDFFNNQILLLIVDMYTKYLNDRMR